MNLVLTLDVGTTALKGALFDLDGQMLAVRAREYALEYPGPDQVELDPEIYWEAAQAVIGEILIETSVAPERIRAVGITSQGETLIVLDQQGRPLRKAIVWLDNRAKAEAELIRAAFGRDKVYRVTGQQDIAPAWPASKILWIRRNEPEVFNKAAKFLMLEDYLVYRLTGRCATDHALNPSTLYYDLVQGCWWPEMLEFLGLSAAQLPDLLVSGESAGCVTAQVGLDRTTQVTVAPIDQIAAAVGAGNRAPGMVTETTGCALAICATIDRPFYDPDRRIGLYRHAVPGLYILMPWIPTAGMVLRWFRDEFGAGEDYTALTEAAESIPPGSDGLIVLPHFCGMSSPEVNPEARGVFYGITTAHHRTHFVRAILESTAFALRDNLELLENCGIPCRDVTALGGAARSRLWRQIKADVLGKPVHSMRCEESTSLGTAVLAAAGIGLKASLEEAIRAMVQPAETVQPGGDAGKVYEAAFQKYLDLNRRIFS
jgi:xylulokinase